MLTAIFLLIKTVGNLVSLYSHSLFFLSASFLSFSSWYFDVILIQSYCILYQSRHKKIISLEVKLYIKLYINSPILLRGFNYVFLLRQCSHFIYADNGDSKPLRSSWTTLSNFTLSCPKSTQFTGLPLQELEILKLKMLYFSMTTLSPLFTPLPSTTPLFSEKITATDFQLYAEASFLSNVTGMFRLQVSI